MTAGKRRVGTTENCQQLGMWMTCEYSCAKIDRIKVKCVLFCKWLYQVESCRFVRSQVPDTRMLHQAKGKKSNLRCKVELISNENLRGQCLNKRVKFLFLPFHLIYLLLLLFFLMGFKNPCWDIFLHSNLTWTLRFIEGNTVFYAI